MFHDDHDEEEDSREIIVLYIKAIEQRQNGDLLLSAIYFFQCKNSIHFCFGVFF